MKFSDDYVLRGVQIEASGHMHGAAVPGGEGFASASRSCGAELALVAADYDYGINSVLHVRDEAAQWAIDFWMAQLRRPFPVRPIRLRLTLEVEPDER